MRLTFGHAGFMQVLVALSQIGVRSTLRVLGGSRMIVWLLSVVSASSQARTALLSDGLPTYRSTCDTGPQPSGAVHDVAHSSSRMKYF